MEDARMTAKRAGIMLVLLTIIALPSASWAGWEEVQANGDRVFISNGMLMTQTADERRIFNSQVGRVRIVSRQMKAFAEGDPEEFCKAVEDARKDTGGEGMPTSGKSVPKVTTINEGAGGTIAGHVTTRYKVIADGEVVEEVWLAEGLDVIDKGMRALIDEFDKCMVAGTGGGHVLAREYRALLGKGWVMKSTAYEGLPREVREELKKQGQPVPEPEAVVETDVVSLKQKNIPPSAFKLPKGFRKVPIKQFILSGMDSAEEGEDEFGYEDEEFYDD